MQDIVEEYAQQNLKLTARQLYYQFVSKDWITNTERSYKNLTTLLTNARYAGLIDWDAIEDRGREPTVWSDFENIAEAGESVIRSFRLPRWKDQPHYVELWVEKQALAGVLEPLAFESHVTLMCNKGYSSASAMYSAAQRFMLGCNQPESDYFAEDQPTRSPVLFYLGDHDPSGEDMVRDIDDRLREFGVLDLEVEKLALTMKQIKEYKPPPNPAKKSDGRYAAYAEKHGTQSWEVDALPPQVLQKIIREALRKVTDAEKMKATISLEKQAKQRLRDALTRDVIED